MKTLAIFGSTGSIGKTSLKIYENNKNKFNLLYLSAHTNFRELLTQYKKYKPKRIMLTGKINNKFKILKPAIEFKNLNKLKNKIDYVISGFSGYEALQLNLKLLKISKNLLIANKETIICGGNLFMNAAKKNRCNLLPIDSEHYCVNSFLNILKDKKQIDKVYLMASGGPFFKKKKISYNEKISNVLNHPNWKMGKKITVDSSNLTNKILELFEAKILFNLPSTKLKIKIEETSNVHAIIKLKNKLYFSIMHYTNMYVPISSSLNLDHNYDLNFKNLKIKFHDPDKSKFPLIKLGYKLLNTNSNSGMILFTVLNERLVKLYLKKKIRYGDITHYLLKAFKNIYIRKMLRLNIKTFNDIKYLIETAQNFKLI